MLSRPTMARRHPRAPIASIAHRRAPHAARTRERLLTWAPPLLAGGLFIGLYILGAVDIAPTPPLVAIDSGLLLATALYFPMRYAGRLGPRGRLAAALFAIVWLGLLTSALINRILPPDALLQRRVAADQLPLALGLKDPPRQLELVVRARLGERSATETRTQRWSLRIGRVNAPPLDLEGTFFQTTGMARREGNRRIDLLRSRQATVFAIDNPGRGDLEVLALEIRGRGEKAVDLVVLPTSRPPAWLVLGVGALLLAASVLFDRTTGAGATAASATILTGAAVVGTAAFLGLGEPEPGFRELFAALVIGALIGGPLGGIIGWLAGNRKGLARGG